MFLFFGKGSCVTLVCVPGLDVVWPSVHKHLAVNQMLLHHCNLIGSSCFVCLDLCYTWKKTQYPLIYCSVFAIRLRLVLTLEITSLECWQLQLTVVCLCNSERFNFQIYKCKYVSCCIKDVCVLPWRIIPSQPILTYLLCLLIFFNLNTWNSNCELLN